MDGTWSQQSTRVARAACLGAALVLALPLLLPQAGAVSHAQTAGDEFVTGFGSARGTALSVGPSRSGFNFTTDFAISLTDYQNTIARADSRAVSLGAILDAVWEAFDEDNEHGPQNLRTDSRDDEAADGISRSELGTDADSPFAATFGRQYVRADEDPVAEAETAMGAMGFPEALLLEGGRSWSQSGVVADGQREAHGTSSFERIVLGGGEVVLEGLEWEALHRTGEEDLAEAGFTLGNLYIDGEPVFPQEEAEGLDAAFDAANEALSTAGVRLEAPEVVEDERTGEIRVTPMKAVLGPSEPSRAVGGPLSDGLQPIREPVAEALIEGDESFGSLFLLFDVTFGVFAGGGELLLEIGGARAHTGFAEFDNPFGDVGGGVGDDFGELPDDPQPQAQDAPERTSGQPDSAPGTDDAPAAGDGTTSEPPTPQTDEPVEEPVDEPVTSEAPQRDQAQQEELAAPAGAGGAQGGQALTAALVALLVAAGLGGADYLRLRQSQRTIPG